MPSIEEQYKELQKQNKIRVICNKEEAKISKDLKVSVQYTCGHTEELPLLQLLQPQNYQELLLGDTTFQLKLKCNSHCHNHARLLKLKPFKNEKDFKEIYDIDHGRLGYADMTIKIV
jgi:hypothetical protein